jgi:hypothetical protein
MSHEFVLGGYSMLVRAYAFVHVPAELVCARVVADHGEWLSPLAAVGAREGDDLRLRIRPIESLPMLGKTVTVHVGMPLARDEGTVVPITWQATGSQGLFPALTADLEVAGVGPRFTRPPCVDTTNPRSDGGSTACCSIGWPRPPSAHSCAASPKA